MKIAVTKVEEVHLDKSQMREITLDYLKDYYGIDGKMWIEEKEEKCNLMEEKEYFTNKKFYDQELVRPATILDRAVLEVIKDIEKCL